VPVESAELPQLPVALVVPFTPVESAELPQLPVALLFAGGVS